MNNIVTDQSDAVVDDVGRRGRLEVALVFQCQIGHQREGDGEGVAVDVDVAQHRRDGGRPERLKPGDELPSTA